MQGVAYVDAEGVQGHAEGVKHIVASYAKKAKKAAGVRRAGRTLANCCKEDGGAACTEADAPVNSKDAR